MSLMKEYINKKLGVTELENELLKLISEYNKLRNSYLFVFSAAAGKRLPLVPIGQDDFYMFHDLLSGLHDVKKVDVYIETPGGRGETAEDIVKFLHDNFDKVSFVVSGEAKSAGTIMVLSGDEILMTKTGSLGPIDAQMQIGRTVISAYDYIEWVDEKRKEAQKQGKLNPFDATMVAQITPGEIGHVFNALKFAEDLVVDWLIKYKFKTWKVTKTRKISVTDEMKKRQAKKIARELTKHSKWRLHGRSIKINDLADIGLQVNCADDDPKLAELIYRIQTICRLLFDSTSVFKIFATEKIKIFRSAALAAERINLPKKQIADVIDIKQPCSKCGKLHNLYAKFAPDPQIDVKLKKKGMKPFPIDSILKCDCGFETDLSGLRSQIEMQTGKKIILNKGGKT